MLQNVGISLQLFFSFNVSFYKYFFLDKFCHSTKADAIDLFKLIFVLYLQQVRSAERYKKRLEFHLSKV